ncbi:MAG: MFS transporter [Candidatus Omnitrophica bacterium]|nr:MFS transporter [Candidatus Omnitrophota bacterium]
MMTSSRSTMTDQRRGRPGLAPVFLVVLVDLIGFGIVLPLLPFYATDLGASAFHIGWLFSIYSIAQMVASPLWGKWSDRVGRRPVMLISTLGASCAYLAFAFSHTFWLLFLSRLAAGLAGGNIAAAQAYVADVTEPKDRAKGMGMIGAAFGIGFAVGPALSVLLLQPFWGDWAVKDPYLLPGLFAAAMSLLSFVFVWLKLPESLDRSRPTAVAATPKTGSAAIWNISFWHDFFGRGPLKGSVLPMLWTASWALAFAQSSLYGAFPLFCHYRYGLEARGIGSLYVLMGMVAVLVQGGAIRVLTKHYSEQNIFLTGAVCLIGSLLMMPWMGSFGLFAAMMAFMTLGASLCTPTLSSLISKEAPEGSTGEALGRGQGMAGLGRAMGPAWGGWLYDLAPALPFTLTGLVLLPAAALGLRLRRKKDL